jgi:signal transduction histidine kinase
MKTKKLNFSLAESLIPICVLIFISYYTISIFINIPFIGFTFHGTSGTIEYIQSHENDLHLIPFEDRVISINGVNIQNEYANNPGVDYFSKILPGDIIAIQVEKDGEVINYDWRVPQKSVGTFLDRLNGQWLWGYIFWVFGFVAFLFLRPKDIIWKLFISFSFLSAMWLELGGHVSRFHFGYGLLLLRVLVWLTIPVLIHLHLEFPKSMINLGKKKNSWVVYLMYFLFISVAIKEVVFPTKNSFYSSGFLVALLVSFIIIVIRRKKFPKQKEELKGLSRSLILAFSIIFSAILATGFFPDQQKLIAAALLLGMPLIPFAYFSAISRGRLGKFEFRSNRIVSVYLYMTFQMLIWIVIIGLVNSLLISDDSIHLLLVFSAVATSLFSISIFPRFQLWVERVFLNIPLPHKEIEDHFLLTISNFLNIESLSDYLESTLLPSLQIRQSGILLVDGNHDDWLYATEISRNIIPTTDEIASFEGITEEFINPLISTILPDSLSWVRVILKLQFNEEVLGYWMFGEKNPDDIYSAREIQMLVSIARQLTLSIVNMRQSRRLRAMFQANLSRHEVERAEMGREIHDLTLNSLAQYKERLSSDTQDQEISEIIKNLRRTIQGLRPEFLEYGLKPALEDFVDSLNERQSAVKVEINLGSGFARLPEELELQTFRIVQQACENALKHALPSKIDIFGQIAEDNISLSMEDNGKGFSSGKSLNLADLLDKKHYGLAIIHERAALVGAKISIESHVDQGTKINLIWQK